MRIPGVRTLDKGEIVMGQPTDLVDDLGVLPSPYLTGFFDELLQSSLLMPILQNVRGCPYQCCFCVSGSQPPTARRGHNGAHAAGRCQAPEYEAMPQACSQHRSVAHPQHLCRHAREKKIGAYARTNPPYNKQTYRNHLRLQLGPRFPAVPCCSTKGVFSNHASPRKNGNAWTFRGPRKIG